MTGGRGCCHRFADSLSGEKTVFIEVPHEFVFHDELINPRGINTRIGGLIKEFHRGNPQLQVCLARLDNGRTKAFARWKPRP